MPIILAHRGNTVGPNPATENTVSAVQQALASGWGIEIDIRSDPNGRFYISHDPRSSANECPAGDVLRLLRAHRGATVAINVKELGYEAELLRYLDGWGVLEQSFLFDMELLERRAGDTARRMRRLHPGVRLAARVSDRGESLERALSVTDASVVWMDEFDRHWCTEADVRRLKSAGRAIKIPASSNNSRRAPTQ